MSEASSAGKAVSLTHNAAPEGALAVCLPPRMCTGPSDRAPLPGSSHSSSPDLSLRSAAPRVPFGAPAAIPSALQEDSCSVAFGALSSQH